MIAPCHQPKANVLGISVDAVDMESAIRSIDAIISKGEKGYVCLAGVHGIMEARRNKAVARCLANAALVAPDGMPTVWVGHFQGHAAMQQVTGPDLMLEVMQRPQFHQCTHFLYGGKEGIAQELCAKLRDSFPSINIIGTYTPPFGPLSQAEEEQVLRTINALRPDIVWVGISTPRQEQFMEQYLPRLDVKLMFGVGAAFDFHTGHITDCSRWIKRCGMQWFLRSCMSSGEPVCLVPLGSNLYELSVQPLYFGPRSNGSQLGFVIIGYAIDQQVAQQVSEVAAADVAFLIDGNVVVTTLPASRLTHLQLPAATRLGEVLPHGISVFIILPVQ